MTPVQDDLWIVRMVRSRQAKIVVHVLEVRLPATIEHFATRQVSERPSGVRVRVVTQEPPEHPGTWYLSADLEWVERIGAVEFGYDTAWPLREIVAKLAEATEHLMVGHNCDAHGHELYMDAHARAVVWLKART